MDNNSRYLNTADTYKGLETEDPAAKAGTEELDFLSLTGTYNRGDKPCVDFSISEEFLGGISKMLRIIHSSSV